MVSRPRALVLGGTGEVGGYLVRALSGEFEITAASRCARPDSLEFDFGKEPLESVYPQDGVDYVFFCIGMGGNFRVSENFRDCYRILVTQFEKMLAFLNRLDSPPILFHFSSSYIFPRSVGFAKVNSEIRPTNAYGLIKSNQELLIKEASVRSVVLRLGSFFVKRSTGITNHDESRLDFISPEQVLTPTYGDDLVRSIRGELTRAWNAGDHTKILHVVSEILLCSSGTTSSLQYSRALDEFISASVNARVSPCRVLSE